MIDSVFQFLRKLGRLVLILVIILFIGPILAREVIGIDLGNFHLFTTQTVDLPGDNFQVAVSEIQLIDNLALAEYHGIVFLRETLPVKLLGITLHDIELWKHIPGTIRASINLAEYDLTGNVQFTQNTVHLLLPDPRIDSCELQFDEIVEGMSLSTIPLESADDIALVEDAMYQEAQVQLTQKAIDAGILEVAREQAQSDISAVINAIYGEEVSTQVEFVNERTL